MNYHYHKVSPLTHRSLVCDLLSANELYSEKDSNLELWCAGCIDAKPYNFGTTLRCYDKSINAWRVSWMQPSRGEFVNLTGRQFEGMIVNEGIVTTPKPGRVRWSFKEITPDSFYLTGEFSQDDGKTWVLDQEMYATRQ